MKLITVQNKQQHERIVSHYLSIGFRIRIRRQGVTYLTRAGGEGIDRVEVSTAYKVWVHPNWGYSRPYSRQFDSYKEAKEYYDREELGGLGGVQAVQLTYGDDSTILMKLYKEEEE